MSKIPDKRERVHQPSYDTLVRGIGISTVANLFKLFGNANVGQRSLTNLDVAGQFSSDQFFVTKAIRMVMMFRGLNDPAYTVTLGADTGLANITATDDRSEDLYALCAYGATFSYIVGSKTMITGPLWYAPAGGGISGHTTEMARQELTNGVPSHTSILKLGKDVTVAPRQNFGVLLEFFPFVRLGAGQGGAIGLDLDPLVKLNANDSLKYVSCILDGILTRDVQ